MKQLSRRRLILYGAIAIVVIILTTLISAPNVSKQQSGSTFGRSPDGYGAWYAFMSERGTPVQQWQKPFTEFQNRSDTFLRIYPELTPNDELFRGWERSWVEKGNTLILLGNKQSATEAPFSTKQASSFGQIQIDTRRRKQNASQTLLGDSFGAVVWAENIGKGQIIYAATPYLAANAYQDFRSNYEFLAQLVTQNGKSIWVDEYLHSHKDPEIVQQEVGETIFSYLAKTPMLPLIIQSGIVLIVIFWAFNRRFGKPVLIPKLAIENSTAYIQALAGVLQKANSSDFLQSTIAKEEQRQLQIALGLEEKLLEPQVLIDAWVQQTGRSPNELESLLKGSYQKHSMNEVDLLAWMEKWQNIRKTLASNQMSAN